MTVHLAELETDSETLEAEQRSMHWSRLQKIDSMLVHGLDITQHPEDAERILAARCGESQRQFSDETLEFLLCFAREAHMPSIEQAIRARAFNEGHHDECALVALTELGDKQAHDTLLEVRFGSRIAEERERVEGVLGSSMDSAPL